MANRSVGFVLGTDGKATVKQDFAEVKAAGQDAMTGVADAAEVAAERSAKATDAFATRQVEAWKRQAAAAKVSAAQVGTNASFDAALSQSGNGSQFATVNLDRSTGAARASATAFEELFQAEDRATAAALDQVAAEGKLAMALAHARSEARANAAQAAVDRSLSEQGNAGQFATVNLDRTSGSAKESAAAFKEMFDAEDAAAAAAGKLRAAIDPLYLAQARYDAELKTWALALKTGEISEEDHAAAVRLTEKALADARRSLDEHSNSLGLNRMQFVIGASAAHRFVDSILAGQSPMRAFMMQAGDVATVLQMDDGGVAGGLAKVRALLTPVTVGVSAAAVAVAIGTTAWLDYQGAVGKFSALAQGVGAAAGASGTQLEAMAVAGASAGKLTVSAAREIETAFLETGKISATVFPGLIALTRDFAAATGGDAKAAAQDLATAFADPAKGAEDLNARLGILDQKTLEYIRTLVEANDRTGAQAALLKALQPALDGATDHVNILKRAWDGVKTSASGAFNAMGAAIDRALTGGPALDRLNELVAEQTRRARGQAPALSAVLGAAPDAALSDAKLASEIAKQRALLATEQTRQQQTIANQRAQATAGIVNAVSGNDELTVLKTKLSAVGQTLGDVRQTSGMTADQLTRTRAAQDALTHAVSTYLPEGEKQAQLGRLDAQIAAAKDPYRKAELAAQRSRIEQSGKVITSAQAEAVAESAGAKAKVEAAKSGESHAATLAREATSMEVNARAALDVADAYLKSSAAGVEAEARRKAATDATKKGIDVEAEVRRDLALRVAEGAAAGAKSAAALGDETLARKAANDNVAAGKLAVAGLNQALSDESALRPLIALQTISQGAAYDKLGQIIAAYRKQLADAHAEEGRSQATSSILALQRRTEDAELAQRYAGDTSGAFERAKAALAARREAADRQYSSADSAALTNAAGQAAASDLSANRATAAAQALKAERDRLAIGQAEIGLVGKSAEEHDRVISRLQLERTLAVTLGDEYEQFAPAILSARDAADKQNATLKVMSANVDELRNFGQSFADKMLSADTWSSWKNAGKSALKEIQSEFLKLALLNPLKNLINGDSKLPTLTSALGSITKLFGGASGAASSYADFSPDGVGHNATGTQDWSGGLTYLNENGGEIADLPNGTRIYPAAESRRMMQAANDSFGQAVVHNHYHIQGNLLTPEFWSQIQAGDDMAAVRGATGGDALSRSRAARTRKRTMR